MLFELIPPDHRAQLLQHAVVSNVRKVLYVKASRHRILQVVVLEFTDELKNEWLSVIKKMRSEYGQWEEALPDVRVWGRAVDTQTVSAHLKLRTALEAYSRRFGPIDDLKYIKPTVVAMWNRVKVGVDTVSRMLKNIQINHEHLTPHTYFFDRILKLYLLNCHRLVSLLKIHDELKNNKIKTIHQFNDRKKKAQGSFQIALLTLARDLRKTYDDAGTPQRPKTSELKLDPALKTRQQKLRWFRTTKGKEYRSSDTHRQGVNTKDARFKCFLCGGHSKVNIDEKTYYYEFGVSTMFNCVDCEVPLCHAKNIQWEGKTVSCFDLWHRDFELNAIEAIVKEKNKLSKIETLKAKIEAQLHNEGKENMPPSQVQKLVY